MFCFYEDKDGEIINTVQTAVVYCLLLLNHVKK
jgi:hypothetical protein